MENIKISVKDISLFDYLFKTERGKKNGLAVIIAGFSAMFCFMGYELFRTSSESIFLSVFDSTQKVYALGATPFLLFALIYLYGFSLSKFGSRNTMLLYFTFSFISNIFLYFFVSKKYIWAAFLILVFKEAYVVVLSEMYWSYINSILKSYEAKLLNGPVAGLGACGSLIGGYFVSKYAVMLTTEKIFLISSFILIPSAVLFFFSYKTGGEPVVDKSEAGGKKGHIHISLLFENKIVLLIAIVVFIAQVVSTLSDLNFTYYLSKEISQKDLRTAYLGAFWTKTNIISFTMQFLITPFVLKRFNVKYVLVIIPLFHLVTSAYSLFYPSLLSASIIFMIFKSMDYSIYRASKEILYIPFSYDTRYRIKQVVDAFIYRFSKGFISIILSLIARFSFSYIAYLIPSIMFFSGVWSYVATKFKVKEIQ
ncbi:MAG: hypothetical protein K6357_02910 [Elusimicrobiota bacterium]